MQGKKIKRTLRKVTFDITLFTDFAKSSGGTESSFCIVGRYLNDKNALLIHWIEQICPEMDCSS